MNGHSEIEKNNWIRSLKGWSNLFPAHFRLEDFLDQLSLLIDKPELQIFPKSHFIFRAYEMVPPEKVKVVLLGEDPYPRQESAQGIAFWDGAIKSWDEKGRGNCMANIFKALLVQSGQAHYETNIQSCRNINREHAFVAQPENLFKSWMDQGVLLLNASLTFPAGSTKEKRIHHQFWAPFTKMILNLLQNLSAPFFIGWGKKAQRMISDALETPFRHQFVGHPTYIHQFLKKDDAAYSPFTQLAAETSINWLGKP